jgi:hypothetical protein
MGAYLVARAAARDSRAAALILDDGIYDFHRAFTRALPPFVASWIEEGKDDDANAVLAMLTTVNSLVRFNLNNGLWYGSRISCCELGEGAWRG